MSAALAVVLAVAVVALAFLGWVVTIAAAAYDDADGCRCGACGRSRAPEEDL